MDLRFELCKLFGGLRTDTLNELEQIVITYAKEYQALQLLQADVMLPFCNECGSRRITPQEPNGELLCSDCWSMDISKNET